MRSSYVRALLIIGVCLLLELIFIWLFRANPSLLSRQLLRVWFVAGVLVGLLLLSPAVRYLGALLLAGSAIYTAWSFASAKIAVSIMIASAIAANTLFEFIAVYLLVFSHSFSEDFSARRANAPPFVSYMRKAFWGLVAVYAIWMTLLDIQNLTK